jgi:hypothetical protein
MLASARAALERLFTKVGMPESHGLGHCLAVLGHMDSALACPTLRPEVLASLAPDRRLALRLAALLHEADDHKYFPAGSSNARGILAEVGAGQPVADEVEEMISYVSASANGNSVPARAAADPSLLWPRWCDRLEAIGVTGAVRCWQYNEEKGDPLVLASSPRPASEKELWAAVTPERWAAYQRGGSSASMMDHYYDKLLQIAVFRPEVVRCPALEAEAARRVRPLVEVCLEAGRTGQAPVQMIRALQKENAAC